MPFASTLAQFEPCDLNHNGFVDVADLAAYVNMIDRNGPPNDLPFYEPNLDCDRDGLHITINDLVGLGHRLIHGYAWGNGNQWWLPSDSLYIPEMDVSPGDPVDVPIYVYADHPIAYVHLGLKYDPHLLQIEEFIVSDSLPFQYSIRGYSIDGYMSIIVQLAPLNKKILYCGHLGNLRTRALVEDPGELETVIEFFNEPRWALHNGVCSFDYVHDAPGIQLFFTHPTTVDGIIRIVDGDRLDKSDLSASGIDLRAYPNPFNSSVEITVEIESENEAEIAIFNILGREVARLHDGHLPGGRSVVTWRADDQPSGVYFCRVLSNGQEVTKRITLMR
jgi:hypothetical protein